MDIKIIKNIENFNVGLLNAKSLLESIRQDSDIAGIQKDVLYTYDLEAQKKYEIMPETTKYVLGNIVNATFNDDSIYFFTIEDFSDKTDNQLSVINLIRYNYNTKKGDIILSFQDDINVYSLSKKLKVFILNDLYLIIQHEYTKQSSLGFYDDFFDFELKLYNMKEHLFYNIVDENFVNNGIDTIIPITENQSIFKTGYTLLDKPKQQITKENASLESISFVNISQLISDMLINKTNISIETIDQSFYNKTFPYIKKDGDYLIYSCVDVENNEEEVIFYDYINKETRNCINKNVNMSTDLALSYIIDNEPYICLKKQTEVSFFNLKTQKIQVSFELNEEFVTVANDNFIFAGKTEKTLFKKSKAYFDLYNYPQKNLILHENDKFLSCLCPDKDNMYIFVQ